MPRAILYNKLRIKQVNKANCLYTRPVVNSKIMNFQVVLGDITKLKVDAIVKAANRTLLGLTFTYT